MGCYREEYISSIFPPAALAPFIILKSEKKTYGIQGNIVPPFPYKIIDVS